MTTGKGVVGEDPSGMLAERALRDRTWAYGHVTIVDPAGIEQASPRGRADLYVALTRTTRRLGLVSHGELPGGLTAVLDQPPGQRIGGRL